MKKTITLVMTGIAVLLFANSQTFAASELGFGDDMGEGISFAETKQPTASYSYDNSLPSATDMMTEGVVLTETFKDDVEYIGDNSIDSMQHLMSGGICMETLSETIATR